MPTALVVQVAGVAPSNAAVVAPVGQSFTVTPSDLQFILTQIKIAERHTATLSPLEPCSTLVGTAPFQIADALVSKGLRTVDGSCNNLIPGQETFGAADEVFPRIASKSFRDAEDSPENFFGPGSGVVPSNGGYTQKQRGNMVFDSEPRVVSNLIVDQTSTNPAAVAAAGTPVRAQGGDPVEPCTTDPDETAQPPVEGVPAGCVPTGKTLFMPNVTTDVGLSPPYNSMFTLFGQFFDHGVDQTVKGGGTVFVPLKADDPLRTVGPDHKANTGDEVPASQAFMVLTRAKNQPGEDGILGNADDVQDAANTDSPWVDQSQTYTSHSAHQVFLREYDNSTGRPLSTGKLLGGAAEADGHTSMANWADVKEQAATKLGLQLADKDVLDIPMVAADPYGNFIPGDNGLPQYVTTANTLVEGDLDNPVAPPANVRHFDTPFLTDIAHNADPTPQDTDRNPATPPVAPTPDGDTTASADFASQAPGTYDDEMLDLHFAAGDGRVNENIGLTAIHQVFHSEHDRLVADITKTLAANPTLEAAYKAPNRFPTATDNISFGFGGRLFQAARFVTEMEYQHLVFEEFARKVQPGINPFEPFAFTQTEINPAIKAEFAHAVYRFGHSMLTDTISRRNEDKPGPDGLLFTADDVQGSQNDISLLQGFLNPPAYYEGGTEGTLNSKEAAGSIIMGMSDQPGNELDEFVTETLRNNLLGLPLDLASVNMARARSEGVPTLNNFRREVFEATNDGAMAPYTSWIDFGEHLKHPESLINFVAAYGKHPSITSETTLTAKRDAARAIVDPRLPQPGPDGLPGTPDDIPGDVQPDDAAAFMNSAPLLDESGAVVADKDWSAKATGLDSVDLWVGGLAEVTNVFGGLLGSTFNYVFENQLTDLQNADRLYYLARTPGMNLRTQLEGNSFAEMMMRNTNAQGLKADSFATADCKFELKNLKGTPAGYAELGNIVVDDPASECNERLLLIRKPDGTIQYRARNTVDPAGINGQSVYNGTGGVDRVYGGNDSDTFWGGLGNDRIEGGDGADIALGGEGSDIITDLNGDDVPKGGPGNDALDAGPGLDIIMGGEGKDFTNGGANANETFGGDGDDFIMLGESLDAAFGDSGDDYEEGGNQPDLMQGDSGNLFFLDDSQTPGSDILVGQGGDDDYDMEGGDDIGVGGPGIEKVAGASGYDWEIGIGDPVRSDMDLAIPLIPLDILQVGVRDKFNEVESLSGGDLNDVLRGDDVVPAEVGGGGFIGCDVLDQAGLDRINGLDALVPPLATPLQGVIDISAAQDCPILSGPVWGAGNILLGGAGNDLIQGRGADDIIDGDKYLNVRLSVRNAAGTEIGSTTVNKAGQSPMTQQYLRDAAGALTGPTLQQAVFAGTVNPGNIVAVKEIVSKNAAPDCGAVGGVNCDTALFSGARADYTISTVGDHIEVSQTGDLAADQKVSDGVDTLRNIERLRFSDATVTVSTPAAPTNVTATAGNRLASVTWTPPSGTIDSYEFVTKRDGVVVAALSATGISRLATGRTVTNLVPGANYTFEVRAVNQFGNGPFGVSNEITAKGAPAAPTGVVAVARDSSVDLSWTPGSNNGDPITGYQVQVRTGTTVLATRNVTGAVSSATIDGLTNGTLYNFRLRAVNSVGVSGFSVPSNQVRPATVPGPARVGTPTLGNVGGALTAVANWDAPLSNGGSAVTGYRITPVQVDGSGNETGRLATVNRGSTARALGFTLPAGSYRFEVIAFNAIGNGPAALSTVFQPR